MARRFAVLAVLAVACSSQRDAPRAAEVTSLPAGVAARVADDDIAADLVRAVAQRQGVSLDAARERLVADALFAAHARGALRGSGFVESAERSALARAVLEEIRREAEQAGPPSDAEVEEVTQLRWMDFARPVLVRTTHVVVLDDAPQKSEATRRVAERLREALVGVADGAAFEAKLKGIDAEGLKTKVEHLPPVAPDGRLADPKQPPGAEVMSLEAEFAKAAHAVAEVPGLSPVVETRYGLHVILAEERIPEKTVPLEERRVVLAKEIVDRRARKRHQQILEDVNRTAPVMLDRSTNDLLARVQVVK